MHENFSMWAISLLLGAFSCISSAQTVNPPVHPVYTRNPSATKPIAAPAGKFVLWINPEHWREVKRENDPSLANQVVVYFETTNGQARAMLFTGEAPDSKERSKDDDDQNAIHHALFGAEKVAPKEEVVLEKPVVNGQELDCSTYESPINGRPTVTYGCSYVGRSRAFILLAYCAKEVFEENQSTLRELLSGMEIRDETLPAPLAIKSGDDRGPQLLTLNDGKIKLTYDSRKWTRVADDDKGRIWFDDRQGNASAFIVADLSQRSTDEVANLRVANSNHPKVLLRERRTVKGTEMCFMILSNRAPEQEFTSYGYYYGGKAGSFELVVTTSADMIAGRASDFMELLNGLQIVE